MNEFWDNVDADPEDVATIRAGLAEGIIEWAEVPGVTAPDFEPIVSERMRFKLLADHVRRLRELDPDDFLRYRKMRDDEKKEKARAPYVVGLIVLVTVGLFAFLVCEGSDDRCVTGVQTRDGYECVEYESELDP